MAASRMPQIIARNLSLLVLVLGGLVVLGGYATTLQTIPNGSDHYFMIDVGETQAVLNTWGTLHATGYPHYVVLGNLGTAGLRLLGVSGVTGAALVSLGFTVAGLALLLLLAYELTGRFGLAVAVMLFIALTRTVWVHAVIAEVYSFGFLLQVVLLWLALTPRNIPYRVSVLALVGGIGAAHHRGIGLMAPALIVAVWPHIWTQLRARPQVVLGWLGLGLLGWLPYLYLPLQADATWAYGELDSVAGVVEVARGEEFAYLLRWPENSDDLRANTEIFINVLRDDISLPVLVTGVAALLLGLLLPSTRRPALALSLAALVAFIFNTVFYYAILSTLVISVTLALVLGLALVWAAAEKRVLRRTTRQGGTADVVLVLVLIPLGVVLLWGHNHGFIDGLTSDDTGLQTIALAETTPPDATLMLAWGPRYFAVGVAQDVQGRLPGLQRVDHRGNFAQIVADGRLVTPDYTLFAQPPDWWAARLGQPVVLRAVGPRLVEIDTERTFLPPDTAPPTPPDPTPIAARSTEIRCDDIPALYVEWVALETPTRNLSVLVHLLDMDGNLLGTADQFAPVYGWRPLITWQAGELVTDVYPLDVKRTRPGQVVALRLGLYERLENGEFVNYNEQTLAYPCAE